MSRESLYESLAADAEAMRAAGTYKPERVIASPQGAHVRVADGRDVLVMCANNYLGLANHSDVVGALMS